MILQFPPSSHRSNLATLGVTSNEELSDQRLNYQLGVLELTAMLHRKKDLSLLLECFFIEVQKWVRFDGILHQPADGHSETLIGAQRQHRVQFEIKLGDQSLGEIVFLRATRFSAREERELERQVVHLVYPVREALIHADEVRIYFTDELTGLQNRSAMEKYLPREVLLSQRNEVPLSIMMLDLDRFASLNENHGYAVGDEVLESVAGAIARTVRKSDMIFRYDTDSFVIALSGTEYNGAKVLAERIRTAIDTRFAYDNVQIMLSASAGITQVMEHDTADSVVDRALAALINAKLAGRNTLRAVDGVAKHIQLV